MITIFTTRDSSNYTFNVLVGGRNRTINFIPPILYGHASEATFSTGDAALVEALKKHPYFGSVFFIKEVIESSATKPSQAAATIEDELKDPSSAIHCETVTTKAMAITYIQGMFEESFSAPNMTVEEMKREAARRWNVIFDKWGN